MTTVSTKTLHCSRCGAERQRHELNGVGLIGNWNDDTNAFCRNIADCHSQEAEDVLSWVSHCLSVDEPDESINDLAPGDPLPEQDSVRLYGFNGAPVPVFGADYEPRPADSESAESQTGLLRSSSFASQPAADLHAVNLDPLTHAFLALQQAEASLAQARLAVQSAIQSAAPLIPVPELDQS
jgi:hypothetical protein